MPKSRTIGFASGERGEKNEKRSHQARTGLLLLRGEFGPGALHAVSQGHPEFGLFLERHGLPPLLNVVEGRVRDGVGGRGTAEDHGLALPRHGAEEGGSLGSHHDCYWDPERQSRSGDGSN